MLADLGKYFVVGGAGFIGSHLVDALLGHERCRVTVFDNFSSGRRWHLEAHANDPRLTVVEGNAADLESITTAMRGHDAVVHLASNPDIARAAIEPSIDFYQGTLLTQQVLEAVRICEVSRLLYASGSGIYGERGEVEIDEYDGPFTPISTYGASKLAGEALIASYCAMFGLSACAFRFGNVVGARQTHGVGYDFLRRLHAESSRLRILGDGRQSKPYVHVSDAVAAMLLMAGTENEDFRVFNVATDDALCVREIAEMAARRIAEVNVTFEFGQSDRGWKGDVPVVRLKSDRIRSLGWQPALSSRQAMLRSLEELSADERTFWN